MDLPNLGIEPRSLALQSLDSNPLWDVGLADVFSHLQPTPVFLSGKSHRSWSLVGYRPWGHKESDTTERTPIPKQRRSSQVALVVKNPSANVGDIRTRVWSLGPEDPLEEGMATHSSILVYRIIDRGAWQTIVHGISKNQTQPNWLCMHAYIHIYYSQDECNIMLVVCKSDKQKCIQNLCIREISLNQSH